MRREGNKLLFMKVLLVLFSALSGYFVALRVTGDDFYSVLGLLSGIFIAALAIILEENVKKTPLRIVAGGSVGLIIGLTVANLVTYPLINRVFESSHLNLIGYLIFNCVLGYVGLSVGMRKGDEFQSGHYWSDGVKVSSINSDGNAKIIDTSVIIDGRIADICDAGFIEGVLIIPNFVLQELQHIADSSDSIKRTRGKRGLDILQKIQNQSVNKVEIVENDYPDIKEVDSKLVALAKDLSAKVVTNDSNLYKVAELQGVAVLNINHLASALKPVVLPGEVMHINILKEGKEDGQGIAYLDDGTMIVVDHARRCIGQDMDVLVTSVLQTTGGRMIFAKPKDVDMIERSAAGVA